MIRVPEDRTEVLEPVKRDYGLQRKVVDRMLELEAKNEALKFELAVAKLQAEVAELRLVAKVLEAGEASTIKEAEKVVERLCKETEAVIAYEARHM